MLLDLLRYLGGPLLAAIIGGVIVHLATRRRDAENERRKQRIEYLLKAYRTLAHSTHRDMSKEQQEAFEGALSDVVLLGDDEQIRVARYLGTKLAEGGEASVDELLASFRRALRQELGLRDDGLTQVPVVRFGQVAPHTPLRVVESWNVKRDKAEASVVAAVAATAPATAHAQNAAVQAVNLKGMTELRELARVAPGAAVVGAYGRIRGGLATLLTAGDSDARDAPDLAHSAAERGLITPETLDAVQGLAVMKDLSRRDGAGTGLDPEKAIEYIDLAAAILYVISRSGRINHAYRAGTTDADS